MSCVRKADHLAARGTKPETRIIPEDTPPSFLAQHLKAYEWMRHDAAGKRVLEVGCGDGYGSYYLSEAASEVIGIDYEEGIIREAQTKYQRPNLRFMAVDATALQFNSGAFDIVCSFQVVEHISGDRLSAFLREIKRVLKPNGTCYLSTLNVDYVMKGKPDTYQKNPAHCKEFGFPELRGLLRTVFPRVEIVGLHQTAKFEFFQRLKKSGICKVLPARFNPVSRFYKTVTTRDFIVSDKHLGRAIDFYCVCT